MKRYLARGIGMFEMTSSSFEKHALPHIGAGDGFQRWGCSCFSFTPDIGHNWGSLEESAPPLSPPLLDLHPTVGPPGV